MNHTKFVLIAALLGAASTAALAADPASESTRRERMDRAYQDYRNPNPGPAARAESSMKRGAHRSGEAVERSAKKVGHAVRKGVHKTGDAMRRGGAKLDKKTAP